MQKKLAFFLEKSFQLLVVYTIGLLLGFIFYFLKSFKVIRVKHWERFPRMQGNVIIMSNHPSLVEPWLLAGMLFAWYFLHPFKYAPISTPDLGNYYVKWWFFPFRPFTIPVPRNDTRGASKALLSMIKSLIAGMVIILFPEGGRTGRGSVFLYSKRGARIRPLTGGVGLLAKRADSLIVSIWIKGTHNVMPILSKGLHSRLRLNKLRGVSVSIGKPMRIDKAKSTEEIVQVLASSLLSLADEE